MSNYLVCSAEKASKKDGSTYYRGNLSSIDGKIIAAVYWCQFPDLTEYEGQVIDVTGTTSTYNDKPQLKIESFTGTNEDPKQYFPKSPIEQEAMLNKLHQLIDSIEDKEVAKFVKDIFDEVQGSFAEHPAAKALHHAFVGGLLHHTIFVTLNAMKIAANYKGVNKSIVIAGALLHDIGKLQELTAFPNLDYTRLGDSVGHTGLGLMFLDKHGVNNLDPLVRDKLLNCIASHHGRLDYGACVLPICAEAWIVHVSDLVDSKIERIAELSADAESGSLLPFDKPLESVVIAM